MSECTHAKADGGDAIRCPKCIFEPPVAEDYLGDPAAPRCCDPACRYFGQRHATAHEPRETP